MGGVIGMFAPSSPNIGDSVPEPPATPEPPINGRAASSPEESNTETQ